MKSLLSTLGMTVLSFGSSATTLCDPMQHAGNSVWVNPEQSTLLTTPLHGNPSGGDCQNQIFVNNTISNNSVDDYAYFLPEVQVDYNNYSFDFSIDFREILPLIGTGNRIDFFEFYVSPENQESITHLAAKIRIKKKPLLSGDFAWKVHVIWSDLPDASGNIVTNEEDYFWLSGHVDFGLLHFHIDWTGLDSDRGFTSISVYSGSDLSYNGNQIFINTNVNPNFFSSANEIVDFVHFTSPFQHQNMKPAETRIGIISHDNGVSIGDGMTFRSPLNL